MKTAHLANEIYRYSQYSTSPSWAQWYAKVLPFKAARTIKILKKYKNEQSLLLDVGCSAGLTLAYLAKKYTRIIGYDIDRRALEAAKNRFQKMGLKARFILGDGQKIALKNNSVDIVTCLEVFEHMQNPEMILAEIRRTLKPDGILHITTANRLWPFEPHFHLPFLSFLPPKVADLYVRITKKGRGYENIKLPLYREFYNTVSKFFVVEDVTLDIIKCYWKYGMEKERGKKIILIAFLLRLMEKLNISPKLLLNFSLGWLFICRPIKNGSKN